MQKVKNILIDSKIEQLHKYIRDKKMIHEYIKKGKDLSELKSYGINFVQPL